MTLATSRPSRHHDVYKGLDSPLHSRSFSTCTYFSRQTFNFQNKMRAVSHKKFHAFGVSSHFQPIIKTVTRHLFFAMSMTSLRPYLFPSTPLPPFQHFPQHHTHTSSNLPIPLLALGNTQNYTTTQNTPHTNTEHSNNALVHSLLFAQTQPKHNRTQRHVCLSQ